MRTDTKRKNRRPNAPDIKSVRIGKCLCVTLRVFEIDHQKR
jgi:hypothetical protein